MKTARFVLCAMLSVASVMISAGEEKRPAVLFLGGVHSSYVVKPLDALGLNVDVAKPAEFAKKLGSDAYNVAIVGVMNEAERAAVDAFVARGGGVLVCNPESYPRETDFTATCQWLEKLGARERWENLRDQDAKNVVSDSMGCKLSWSDQISAPVNEGVRGVLTLMWNGTTGCEPPMSLDFGQDWTVLVRGAASMDTAIDKRNDIFLLPWIPKQMVSASPPLLASRQIGTGRMAVLGIRNYWLFNPPTNCPTAEAMLSAGVAPASGAGVPAGAAGERSNWLRVTANTMRWLAEPSLKAGKGGASTPAALLNPPVEVWPLVQPRDWTKQTYPKEQRQTPGLIGARTALSGGSGSVADYVMAAKAAGLQFIVFLEDCAKLDETKWKQLVSECDAASAGTEAGATSFAAVPGLIYEDAQGNHLYTFADNVQYPTAEMLLPDKRLATNQSNRTKAYFDFVNERIAQRHLGGFWRHKENQLIVADYKLYNSFPIFSFENGKQIDSAFADYQYLMSHGACNAALAFEIMDKPEQVAQRAKEGWRVVAHRSATDLRKKWHEGAWSFSGSGSQYITNGPAILVWDSPNRCIDTHGEWWRPDLWQFRVFLKVGSDVGLKTVSIYDGDKLVRRWLPQGAKTFEQELVLSNCQQMGLFPVVEDTQGRKAIGMEFWNRHLMMEEFFCSDRCNFLGNSRLRTRAGGQVWTQVSFQANMGITPSKGQFNMSAAPAVNLTLNSPTLPIDGAPAGFPTANLRFTPQVPGEHKYLFAYPQTYLVGPEIAIGQSDFRYAYDPAEEGAKTTPLGHEYQQPQHGIGNSWGSWHKLVPTKKLSGFARTYACNWLPGGFRIGAHAVHGTLKEDLIVDPKTPLRVMQAEGKGWRLYTGGDEPLPLDKDARGPFVRGNYAVLEDKGGAVVLTGMYGTLEYEYGKGGTLSLIYPCGEKGLKKGTNIFFYVGFAGASGATKLDALLEFARKMGIAKPGTTGYMPQISRGKQVDNYLVLWLESKDGAIEVKIPKADIPAFVPAIVQRLNENWSVELLDRARPWPNHRALPIRQGFAVAQLDLALADSDLFIGHPVTCDQKDVKILASWMSPGLWYVEAHNPTDKALPVKLKSNTGWTVFDFDEAIELPAGSSKVWHLKTK
ncbi:MAG TPA: hypothetical protein VGP72_14960 [Planctomycetota bacterium]|jgi:hypothetical protein